MCGEGSHVSDFGFQDYAFGLTFSIFGIRVPGFGCQLSKFGCTVSIFGLRLLGAGCWECRCTKVEVRWSGLLDWGFGVDTTRALER